MRQYIAADRKLEAEKERRQQRRRGGCFASLFKAMLFMGGMGLLAWLVWWWHPWSTEIVVTDATDVVGVCSPGVQGTRTTEYFTLLGVRLYQSGSSTICVE